MSVYIGESNTARAVKDLYVGVDDVARKVQKAYVGVSGVAMLAYQRGAPIGHLNVGSIVKIKVGNVLTEFIIVHHGLPSDAYDSSCNGTWLLAKDIYAKSSFGSNNHYENSTVNTYLNNTFFYSLDANVRTIVRQVKIPYQSVGGVLNAENGLETRIFLLSATELNISTANLNIIGSRLAYFDAGNSRVAYLDGYTNSYWTRTPYKSDSSNNSAINTNGFLALYGVSNNSGIRPAMILSSDILVDDDNNVMV